MFFLFPLGGAVILVYVLAAVLPAFFLLRYIYRHDTVEKEPMGLLVGLLFRESCRHCAPRCWKAWDNPC